MAKATFKKKRNRITETHFEVEYDGLALKNGQMDVRDLAPALLAVGHLLEEVNHSVNRRDTSVSVLVKADFPRGSFGIDFNIVQTLLNHAKHLFVNQEIKDAHDILELAGFIAAPGWKGFLAVRKWMKGRKIEQQTNLQDGLIRLSISGELAITKPEVIALLSNPLANSAMTKIIRPLRQEGIDEVKIRSDKKHLEETVDKKDLPAFPDAIEQAIASTAPSGALISRRETILRLVTPSFRRGNKYRVIEGDTEFFTTIEDESFLDEVENDEISFSAHGRLRVILRQEIIPGGSSDTIEHAVEEVIEYIHPHIHYQAPLIPPENQDSNS